MKKPLLVAAVLLASPPASGQVEPGDPAGTIHVRFEVDGEGVGRVSTGEQEGTLREVPLEPDNRFLLRPRTRATLLIDNPNPLLFEYALVKKDPVPTENAATIAALVKALGPLFPVPAASKSGLSASAVATPPSEEEKCGPSRLLKANGGPVVHLGDQCLGQFEEALDGVHDLAEDIPSFVRKSATNPRDSKEAALKRLDQIADEVLDGGLESLHAAKRACLSGQKVRVATAVGPGSEVDCWQGLRDYLDLVLDHEASLQSARKGLEAFRGAVAAIGVPIRLAPHVSYSATTTQPFDLTVSRATAYEKHLSRAELGAAGRVLGTYRFSFEPRERVRLRLQPGLVYGLVRVPEFKAVKQGEGLVVKETAQEYSKEELAAMLTVTPVSWAETAFAPHLQVGITPGKDRTAFYVGLGFTATRLSFGVGLVAREVPKLADGLVTGASLASPEELKTVNRFKTGLYFQVGLVP